MGKKWKKKADLYRVKMTEMEAEKSRLESKLRQQERKRTGTVSAAGFWK